MAKKGYNVYAVDLSPTAVKMCRKKLSAFPELRQNINERVIVHDIVKPFPFPKNFFDVAISFSVLHHNTPRTLNKTLKNIHKILKKEGLLFITVGNKNCIENSGYEDPIYGNLFKCGARFWVRYKEDVYYPIYDRKIGNLTIERNSLPGKKFKPVYHIFFNKDNINKYFGKFFDIFDVREDGIFLLISMKKR